MSAPNSTERPGKPYPEFPLYAHKRGYWAKKYKGKHYNCGHWDDPKAALKRWEEIRNKLELGRDPSPRSDGVLTVKSLCRDYLTAKRAKVQAGDLEQRSWDQCESHCRWLVKNLGPHRLVESLKPADFTELRGAFPGTWGTYAIQNQVSHTRMAFKWAYENDVLDRPVKFGDNFSNPKRKRREIERSGKPKKLFTAKEVHRLIRAADPQMRAMILLAMNAGFGNSDLARLKPSEVKGAWLDIPRGKTGQWRRAWLWPETREAIKDVVRHRGKPHPGCEELLFLTKTGREWVRGPRNEVTNEFTELKRAVRCDREGVGFYSIRHTFRTHADETNDKNAIDLIMGHREDDMGNRYTETISDARIKTVCQHVHKWYAKGKPKTK